MKTINSVLALMILFVSASVSNATTVGITAVNWEAFQIRDRHGFIPGNLDFNSMPGDAPAIIEDVDQNGVSATIEFGGQKAGYGTSDLDGVAVADICDFDYDRVDVGSKHPYLNLWVTDGNGNYAILAPFINASGTSTDVRGQVWGDLAAFIYETNFAPGDLDWIMPGAQRVGQELMDASNQRILLSELTHLTLEDPGVYNAPIGTGAPRNGNGFNIIFGDTANNYVQGLSPFIIDNVALTAIPEPSTVAILGLAGLVGIALVRRRQA